MYKLDRISRSILDFSNMMNLFQQYQVEFVSSTEKFDTSTPMGRAMLNICIVFAQLERETIQKRVSDAYYSRSQKGFRMGGKPPYGYRLEEILMEGIHTKKLVEEPGEAAIVREIFDMYEQPDTSYGDITRYYAEKGVQFYGKELIRSMLAQLLRNPVYVRADMDVYRFFRSHGTNIVSSPEQFDGIHGCYLYQGRDAQTDKLQNLKGHMLVVAPHEGLVSSEQWLNCRIKLMRNKTIQANRKAVNTWLAGKVKCGNCGYALMSIKIQSGKQYLRCTKRLNNKACPGCGKVYTEDVENYVYKEMVRKLREGQSPAAYTKLKENPQVKQIYREIEEMEKELTEEKVNAVDIKHFISLIRKCKEPTEISDLMFAELIDKIVVYEAEGVGKARTQKVDIYFNYVGRVDIAYTEEELAEIKAQEEQIEMERLAKQREREKAYREKRKAKKLAETGGEIVKTKICPHCQKEFVATSNRQIFCSKDCCYQARQDQKKADREAEKGNHYYRQRVCAVCGSTYWPTHSQQKFCSEECKKVNHNKKTLEFYYKKQKEKELCKDLLQTKEQVSDTNSSEITIIPA